MSIIKLANICKDYTLNEQKFEALRSVSLEINKGEFVAITGKSGSGKSTLMNVIGLLDSFDSGTYELDNTEIGQMSEDTAAKIRNKKIGFVFQTFNLLNSLNAIENVILPTTFCKNDKKAVKERALQLLTRVGLADKLYNKPNQLSGGQVQRVAIARSLISGPSIILADEPTGNLDQKISADIISFFKQLNREGQTIVLVTHDADVAKQASRVITLDEGVIKSDVKTNANN